MAIDDSQKRRQDIVGQYFKLIGALRGYEKGSVEKLVDLWDADGIFEFCGAPPVTGTFKGRNAIHTLYKNRFNSSGMPIKLDRATKTDVALGVVDTEVGRVRSLEKDDKIVAGWTTRIGTNDGYGFQVSGSHSFKFKGDKISELRVVISPKPEPTEGMDLKGLSVDDIGRLALAAWPVV